MTRDGLQEILREITTIHTTLNEIRLETRLFRPVEVEARMQEMDGAIYRVRKNVFNNNDICRKAGKVGALTVLVVTGGVGASVTAISALSFFAGPVVGVPVTAITGATSLVVTGVATRTAYNDAYKRAAHDVEESVRNSI